MVINLVIDYYSNFENGSVVYEFYSINCCY